MSTLHQSSGRIAALGAAQYHCPGRKTYSPLYTGGLYVYGCQTFYKNLEEPPYEQQRYAP